MRLSTLRRLRPFVQWVAFLLFAFTLVWAGRTWLVPADLFFRLDPLAGVASMLASRQIIPSLLLGGLVALALAVAAGRAWCGWLCPLGTVLDWTPSRRPKPKDADLPGGWRQVKYVVLAVVLVAAALGNLTLLFLDPISVTYRTGASVVWPSLVAVVNGLERALYGVPFLGGILDAFEGIMRGAVLPMYQPLYGLGLLSAALFLSVLALNAIRPRFWCRYLCPLGALLGAVSKAAWLRRRVGDGCLECQRCARACPTAAIDPSRGFASNPSECTMCLDCVPVCARGEQHFGPSWQLPIRGKSTAPVTASAGRSGGVWSYDPSRRQFLLGAAAAVAGVGLLDSDRATGKPDWRLIRPPGGQEDDFASLCLRCGVCIKTCPTSGLQPSLMVAGWGALWTPVLVSRLGQCDYSCNACGQACPTGAIHPLELDEKRQTVIGHTYIDRNRCIPWADGRNCLVCEEMCPLPEKAIHLEETEVWTPAGPAAVKRPYVLHDKCIGCGICENRCPLNGEAAIRVYAPSELGAYG